MAILSAISPARKIHLTQQSPISTTHLDCVYIDEAENAYQNCPLIRLREILAAKTELVIAGPIILALHLYSRNPKPLPSANADCFTPQTLHHSPNSVSQPVHRRDTPSIRCRSIDHQHIITIRQSRESRQKQESHHACPSDDTSPL